MYIIHMLTIMIVPVEARTYHTFILFKDGCIYWRNTSLSMVPQMLYGKLLAKIVLA